MGPSLADGHLRGHVRGSLHLSAGREGEGVPPGPTAPPAASGTLPTTLGTLQLQSGGFMLTGIPLVMGEYPASQVAKAEASLAKVGRVLYHLRPAYVLVLRIVLAYVVSALDYVYDAMPLCPTRLRRTQRALDRVLTRALRVPRNVPRALLWMPVPSRGFRFPRMYSQMRLRPIQGYLRAMDSRSALASENVRALSRPDCWQGLDGPDQDPQFQTMAEVGLEVCQHGAARAVDTQVRRPYSSGGVLLVADGAMETTPGGHTLGWGALVADTRGVLATAASGVLTRTTSPWAAEWAGKLEAWRLTASLGVAFAAVEYVGADCTSGTLGSDGGVPSYSPLVDRVRVAFAKALGRSHPDPYIPAQNNTQWAGLFSNFQAQAHDLAARGPGMAREGTYPLPDALDWTAQMFSSRRLVTAVPRKMDRLYIRLAAPSVTFILGPPGDNLALQAWAQLLTEGAVPTEGLRLAAWVRMAPSTHTSARAELHCAYCS